MQRTSRKEVPEADGITDSEATQLRKLLDLLRRRGFIDQVAKG